MEKQSMYSVKDFIIDIIKNQTALGIKRNPKPKVTKKK